MARIRPSMLADSISGSVGGQTFANTNNGIVVRNKRRPRRKQTTLNPEHPDLIHLARDRQRSSYLIAQRWWAEFTDDERATWAALAAQASFPNKLGTPKTLTPRQLFLREAIFALLVGPNPPVAPLTSAITPPPLAVNILDTDINALTFEIEPAIPGPDPGRLIYAWYNPKPTPTKPPKPLPWLPADYTDTPPNLRAGLFMRFGKIQVGGWVTVGARVKQGQRLWSTLTTTQFQITQP